MVRRLLPVAVLVAVAAALFVLLKPKSTSPVGDDVPVDAPSEARAPAAVKGPEPMPGATARAKPSTATSETSPAATSAEPIEGVVLDDETGKPLAGAWVSVDEARAPCPSEVDDNLLSGANRGLKPDPPPVGLSRDGKWFSPRVFVHSAADGSFRVDWVTQRVDLVVRMKGWVVGSVCNADASQPITVRLRRGLSIQGVVVTPDGKPIEGATIDAAPPKGTPPPVLPGRRERAISDAKGKFAVEGLVEGSLTLEVSHPMFISERREGAAAGERDLRIVMRPAFFVTFTLSTEDRTQPDAPTVEWQVPGTPRWGSLEMLRPVDIEVAQSPTPEMQKAWNEAETRAAAGAFRYEPIKIPAGRPTATFTVKAIGYEAWTSEPVEVPAEGGATSIDVRLRRDPTVGRAVIALEDPDHRPLSFVQERCTVAIGRRDNQPVRAGIVYHPRDRLELPALDAGPWRFVIRSPLHPPAVVDLDVVPGGLAEGLAVLGPPAKVRVRFTAPEALLVKFRVLQGREPAQLFVERASTEAPANEEDPGSAEVPIAAGAEGVVLTGLSGGRHTIEVVDPSLSAEPTSVDLVEGETKDVEIAVARR